LFLIAKNTVAVNGTWVFLLPCQQQWLRSVWHHLFLRFFLRFCRL